VFTDDKYTYQAYMPVGFSNSREPTKKGQPIDAKNYGSLSAQTAGAAAAGFSRSMMYLNSTYTVPLMVQQGILAIRSQIDAICPQIGGVLRVVRKKRDAEGMVSFDAAWIGGSGNESGQAFRQCQNTPILVRPLAKNFDPIFEFYWATPRADRSAVNASA